MQRNRIRRQGLKRNLQALLLIAGLLIVYNAESAPVAKDLAYPLQKPNAYEIAQQVYFVNHFYAFANVSLEKHPRGVAEVINREPGRKNTFLTLERHINNTYTDGEIRSRELVMFRSGQLKGSAVLLTEYEDASRYQNTRSGCRLYVKFAESKIMTMIDPGEERFLLRARCLYVNPMMKSTYCLMKLNSRVAWKAFYCRKINAPVL